MINRYSGSFLGGLVLSLVSIPSAGAETGFNVLPQLDAPGYAVSEEAETGEKRRNKEALWGIASAGIVGVALMSGGNSTSVQEQARSDSGSFGEGSQFTGPFSGKFRDGGITAAPEPGSLALLAGGALPFFGLLRRCRSK